MRLRFQLKQTTPTDSRRGLGLRPRRGLLCLWSLFILIAITLPSNPARAQVWEYLGRPSNHVTAIAVGSRDTIFAAGVVLGEYSGGIYRTVNGGVSWDTLSSIEISYSDLRMHPTNPRILYAARYADSPPNGVMKTTDGGETWFAAGTGIYVDFETHTSVIEIDPEHPETLYVGTLGFLGGDIYKSTNGGMSWASIGTTGLWNGVITLAIDPISTNTLYAGTAAGEGLYKSSNGGAIWGPAFVGDPVQAVEVDPVEPNRIYLGLGDLAAGFRRSTDGGLTWEVTTTGMPPESNTWALTTNRATREIFALLGAVESDSGGIFRSTNLGSSWQRVGGIATQNRAHAVTVSRDYEALYLGMDSFGQDSAGIYRTSLIAGAVAPVVPVGGNVKLLQNYPNPFNPTTTIDYELPEDAQVSLKIYDVLGREVEILVNAFQVVGQHSVTIDARKFSSGVYFYRLETPKAINSKKMVLLR